jgi:hypothetical protein
MNLESLYHLFARLFFFGALALLALAVAEAVLNLLGYTILRETYSAGRLMELAATLLVFVITILLRQIRDALKAGPIA